MSYRARRSCARRFGRAGMGAATAAFALTLAVLPTSASAAEVDQYRSIQENEGPGVSVRGNAFLPSRGQMGFGVDANVTYGVPFRPFVIAPGGRFASYFGDAGALSGMPIVEVMLPITSLVPYVKAGAGVGHASGPNETTLAVMTGAGLDLHLSQAATLGVDASWETISGTGFNAVAIGPRFGLRY